MLSGRPPFRAPNTVAVLKRVVDDTPRPIKEIIPEVPDWICELIGHLHAKNPNERYSSAKQVSDVLAQCLLDVQGGRRPLIPAPDNAETLLRPAVTSLPRDEKRTSKKLLPRIAAVVALLFVSLGLTEATSVTNLSSTVIRMLYGSGTLVIEIDDPSATVAINGEQVTIRGAGVDELTLSPGKYRVEAVKDGQTVRQELASITRNGRSVVRLTLEASAPPIVATDSEKPLGPTPPPLAKAPFSEEEAKQHQKVWADYLGVPIEKEISLGQDKSGKDLTLTMVLIPPGEFMIGEIDTEQKKWLAEAKAEHPNAKEDSFIAINMEDHRFVRITKPFWLSKLEFKTGQFRRFVESTDYTTDAETSGKGAFRPAAGKGFERLPELNWDNWGKFSFDPGPVVNVSWNDAAKCCEWLSSQHPDMAFSLPTEAQWEFACRAGTKNSLYDCESAEQLRQYAQFGDEVRFIQRGGQLRPNAFGLYDMLGNVTEWCSNWAARYDEESQPVDDPAGPSAPGKYAWRAIRGGSFMHNIWRVRSSKRDFYAPDSCFFDRGFRVAAAITNDLIHKESITKNSAADHAADTKLFQWPTDVPPPAIAPFDTEQAKQHQEAWAKHLGVPVEYENSIGMKFRLIPPGEFLMGSTPDEIEAASPVAGKRDEWSEFVASEGPQHRVILTRPLYLGTTEVTQEQYQQIIKNNPSLFSSDAKGKESEAVADLDTTNFPVDGASWYDAVAFCTKLSQREQLAAFDHKPGLNVKPMEATGYRLPTEAEWEFACRAGTGTQITGDKKSKALLETCWFAANSDGRTHAVGELKANPLGLLDMQGNVWEWVQDSWESSFYGSFSDQPAIDPCRPIQSESLQVIRGGYWRDRPTFCRPSCRYANTPDHRYGIGFRVALSVDAVKQPPNAKAVTTALPPFTDADVARIAALPAEQQVEAVRQELKRRNPQFNENTFDPTIEDGVVVKLFLYSKNVTDISPVRALTSLKSLNCSGPWTGDFDVGLYFSFEPNASTNLSSLQGLKLTELCCSGIDVADLSPLRGMPLERLELAGTQVSDLSAIDPRPLKYLDVARTKVTDANLAHFKGCTNLTALILAGNQVSDAGLAYFKDCRHLTTLILLDTNVTDLSLFRQMPLKTIYYDVQPDRDTEILRSIKTLEEINGQTPEQFWKDVEAGKR